MTELLAAGWMRLRRSKFLWLSCLVLGAVLAILILWRWNDLHRTPPPVADNNLTASLPLSDFDQAIFAFGAMAVLLSSAVCAWELGAEYQDGALRNKLAVGRKRRDVYLASLTLSVLTVLLLCLAVYLPGVIALLATTGGFYMGWGRALALMGGLALAGAAFASLFTLLSFLIPHRAAAAIVTIGLTLALVLGGSVLTDRLHAKPTISGYRMVINGEIVSSDVPNPRYIPEGPLRDALTFLADFDPGGQVVRYAQGETERMGRLMAYDALLIVLTSAAGVLIFRRKDLR